MVEVYLNNTLIQTEPEGINDIVEIIEMDSSLHGYVVKYNQITLKFIGDGASFIKNLIANNGYENRVEIKIVLKDEFGYNDTIQAYFFTPDITYNATENTFSVQLEDRDFGGTIKQGSKEKINPATAYTKSEIAITPAVADSITLFTPSTGVDLGTNARVWDIRDVMEVIVKYLSDDSIGFSFVPSLGFRFGLTKHYYIQTRGGVPDNQISFNDLMDFMWRAFGIMFWIDKSAEEPVFVLNFQNDLMEEAGEVSFSQVYDMEVSFDQEIMYSSVELGSSKELIDKTASFYSLPYAPLIGFGEETVNARSVAMIDTSLDLSLDNFICGTNKIESLLSSTSYDETNLIIQYARVVGSATKGTYGISGANRLYNEELLNLNILQRHNVPVEMIAELGEDTDGFRAFISTDSAVASATPMIFNDDTTYGYDTGSNYSTVTGAYTIPNDGLYRFRVRVWLNINSLIQSGLLSSTLQLILNARKGGVTIDSKTAVFIGTGQNRYTDFEFGALFTAGDVVDVTSTFTFTLTLGTGTNSATLKGQFIYTDENGVESVGGTKFETIFTFNGGGAVVTPDQNDFPALNYDFKYPINLKDWKLLRARPIQGVMVDTNGTNSSLAWIKKITRNWITGESDVTLFTKLSENKIL